MRSPRGLVQIPDATVSTCNCPGQSHPRHAAHARRAGLRGDPHVAFPSPMPDAMELTRRCPGLSHPRHAQRASMQDTRVPFRRPMPLSCTVVRDRTALDEKVCDIHVLL